MINRNDFMEYTDDEFIEYIECLEKALDKASVLLHEGYGYEYPEEMIDIDCGTWTIDEWKEWLLKDE